MLKENLCNFKFNVYGSIINFSTNNDILMNEIQKDFGKYQTFADYKPDGKVTIIETERDFQLKIPKYAIREVVLQTETDSAIFSINDSRYLEENGRRILKIDFKKNEIIGYFKPPCEISMFLRFCLKWLMIKILEKKGISFIHGSGVEKDDISFFFVGPSGFGKTYILISMLQKGYNLITDDTILFGDGKILPFHIRSSTHDMINKFPILKEGLNKKSTNLLGGGWLIDLGDIFNVAKRKVFPSKLFYVYVWNAEETKIESIPKKEMLSRLFHIYQIELGNTLWSNRDKEGVMKTIFPNYFEFVKLADCYKVYAGSNTRDFIKNIQTT